MLVCHPIISIGIALSLLLSPAARGAETFVSPSPERLAALLEFPAPVALDVQAVSPEKFARKPERGIPLAAWSYSNAALTSQSFTVAVYRAGEFRRDIRPELTAWIAGHARGVDSPPPQIGIFVTAEGRSILQFPLGFGPGGSAYAALLAAADRRFEIVMAELTNFHDDEDQQLYTHHVTPRKQLREVIAAVEALIFPLD